MLGVGVNRARDISIVRLKAAEVERTLEALVECPTLTAAAQRLGITRQALYKRLQSPSVARALSEQQQALWVALRTRLLQRADAALHALDEVLQARVVRPRELAVLQLKARTALALLDRLAKLTLAGEAEAHAQVVDDF